MFLSLNCFKIWIFSHFSHSSDIDEVNGNDLVNNLNNKGGKALFIKCDVSDYDQVKNAFNQFIDKYGLYILVNNAGVCNNYALTELNPKSIEKTIKTNLLSHFWTVKMGMHFRNYRSFIERIKNLFSNSYSGLPKMLENKRG